jgi:hypothetical protein
MKTLKKNEEIKRMKDSDFVERKKIDELLESGWKYVPKSEWKKTLSKDEPKNEGKKRSKSK